MSLFQERANRILERNLARSPEKGPAPGALHDGALMGRLVIPRLNLRSVVREGTGPATLDVALGHIPETSLPGQPGNVGIAGHRDTLFRGLRAIRENDLIELQTVFGSYSYRVEGSAVVRPGDVGVLAGGKGPQLTLVTCYPFYYIGPAPERFIVKARLLTAEPPEAGHVKPVAAPSGGKRAGAPIRRLGFRLRKRHTSQLEPGILMHLTWTDPRRGNVTGWLFVASEHRTLPLRNQGVNRSFVFRPSHTSRSRSLVITRLTKDSATGYLL